ncbi:MAG: hypothetical protein M3R36_10510 [Bacteroidota bacterium]|nr:hypothetical protein [Bacteroidota bacterium]
MNSSKQKFICQWSLEILFGKQKEALDIMKKWREEKFKSSHFKVSQARMMSGYIGKSASFIIDEYIFGSLDDFEKALADMSQPQFRPYSNALATLVVPGSQKWTIYQIIE